MYVILWEFEVLPRHVGDFRAIYSPTGDWAQLFRRSPGYLGTELLQSSESPTRFFTIDRWRSAEDFACFQRDYSEPYAALDARCQGLTRSERKLGSFITVD